MNVIQNLSSIALLWLILIISACSKDAYGELPDAVAKFVSEYYPFNEVDSYNASNGHHIVRMHNGATIVFDSSFEWIDFNGNGSLLPETFLFNCLPEALYDYLLETQQTSGVFRAERNKAYVTIYLIDTYVSYDNGTHRVIYPSVRDTF